MENSKPVEKEEDEDDVNAGLLARIEEVLSKLSIEKIYFVDDAINLPTDKATFIGIIDRLLTAGKYEELQKINIQNGIDFTTDETVLTDHIDRVWDGMKTRKQFDY